MHACGFRKRKTHITSMHRPSVGLHATQALCMHVHSGNGKLTLLPYLQYKQHTPQCVHGDSENGKIYVTSIHTNTCNAHPGACIENFMKRKTHITSIRTEHETHSPIQLILMHVDSGNGKLTLLQYTYKTCNICARLCIKILESENSRILPYLQYMQHTPQCVHGDSGFFFKTYCYNIIVMLMFILASSVLPKPKHVLL